jgi:hypothetical protein
MYTGLDQSLWNFSEVFSDYQPQENGIVIHHFGDCLCLHHQGYNTILTRLITQEDFIELGHGESF